MIDYVVLIIIIDMFALLVLLIGIIWSAAVSKKLEIVGIILCSMSSNTALNSVGLLDVLYEYDCGGLCFNEPCQYGISTASLRELVRNAD